MTEQTTSIEPAAETVRAFNTLFAEKGLLTKSSISSSARRATALLEFGQLALVTYLPRQLTAKNTAAAAASG